MVAYFEKKVKIQSFLPILSETVNGRLFLIGKKESIIEERLFCEFLRAAGVLRSVFPHRQRVDQYSDH